MLKLIVVKKKRDCNVCFEKKKGVLCSKCKNCHVCHDCLLSMCENGICNKCPHCRQTNWKKSKSKIVPINTNNEIISEQKNTTTSSYVYNVRDERPRTIALEAMTRRGRFYYKLLMTGVMLSLSWMCGFITIIICTSKPPDKINVHLISWVAVITGLTEIHLFIMCCFVNVCKQPIRNMNDYCDMFCTMQ